MSWISTTFKNRYRVVEDLGGGGMADVFKAVDLDMSLGKPENLWRYYVIKRPKFADDDYLRRFKREIDTQSGLNESGIAIVRILDQGMHDGRPFCVLDFMEGGALCGKAEFRRPENVARWLPRLALALDRIHARKLIHRDIKPGNILFDGRGEVWLGDFGLAKSVDRSASVYTTLSRICGTPPYMAPEVLNDKDESPRSDQYSLGVTIFEVFCGRRPYADGNYGNLPLPLLHEWALEYSPKVGAAVARAMANEPLDRFESCTAFAEALVDALRAAPQAVHSIRRSEVDVASLPPTLRPERDRGAGRDPETNRDEVPARATAGALCEATRESPQVTAGQPLFLANLGVAELAVGVRPGPAPLPVRKEIPQAAAPGRGGQLPLRHSDRSPGHATLPGPRVSGDEDMPRAAAATSPSQDWEGRRDELRISERKSDDDGFDFLRKFGKPVAAATVLLVIVGLIIVEFMSGPAPQSTAGHSPGQITPWVEPKRSKQPGPGDMTNNPVTPTVPSGPGTPPQPSSPLPGTRGITIVPGPGSEPDWSKDIVMFPCRDPSNPTAAAPSFEIGASEVTIGQFRRFVEAAGYMTDVEKNTMGQGWTKGAFAIGKDPQGNVFSWKFTGLPAADENCPVVNVSWNDAVEYCNWLSREHQLAEAYVKKGIGWEVRPNSPGYRLPKADEWTSAARQWAGDEKPNFGDSSYVKATGADGDVSDDDSRPFPSAAQENLTRPVNLRGNVHEWCDDVFVPPGSRPPPDPLETARIRMGGGWGSEFNDCDFSSRANKKQNEGDLFTGFRVTRSL